MVEKLFAGTPGSNAFFASSVQAQRAALVGHVVLVILGIVAFGAIVGLAFHYIGKILPVLIAGTAGSTLLALIGWVLNFIRFAEVWGVIAFVGAAIYFTGALCDAW
jgi:hypothetical protein